MERRTLLWIGVGAIALLVLFFAAVSVAGRLLGTRQQFTGLGGVGLVEVKGVIVDGEEVIRQLRELDQSHGVKALVVRVDSPGGVVGPSQEIYAELRKIARHKKVVVSMGSVAASGGYYIAAPATCIYANPGTITGSIGVILKFSNIEGLLGKLGLRAFALKSGAYKDTGSPTRPMTAEEQALVQGVIDNIHGQFVKAVAEGRKLPVEQVQQVADGRIFTGEQALAYKLVDKLGTLQDAIAEAGRLAGLKGEPRIIRASRKQRGLVDLLTAEGETRLADLFHRGGLSARFELDGPTLLNRQE